MPTAKQLMRAGELYPGDDPELNRELDERQAKISALNALPYERSAERAAALAGVVAYGNPARVAREIGERDRIVGP